MDARQKEALRKSRVKLVEDLEPIDVLDQLYEDGIFTENDCERISKSQTRKERCQILLSLLPTRGPSAYGSFRNALQATYPHIEQTISSQYHDGLKSAVSGDDVNVNVSGMCMKCRQDIKEIHLANPALSKIVHRHCCTLLDNVEPNDILDHQYQEHVLSDDECERVRVGKTRRERCKTLLQELGKCHSDRVVHVLKTALQKKYSYIADLLDKDIDTCGDIPLSYTGAHGSNGAYHLSAIDDHIFSHNAMLSDSVKDSSCSMPSANFDIIVRSRPIEPVQKQFTRAWSDSSLDSDSMREETLLSGKRKKVRKTKGYLNRKRQKLSSDAPHSVTEGRCTTDPRGTSNTSVCHVQSRDVLPVYVHPGSVKAFELPGRRLVVAFNHLSTLVNEGKFDKFESFSMKLGLHYSNDPDMLCLLGYLHASRELYRTNFDEAKKHINSALRIAPKTTNPKYFTLELFTAKSRMYITQKKFEKLQDILDDAKMIIETDPVGCTGRAAGWLYMNDGRNKTSLIGLLNPNSESYFRTYIDFHKMAKSSFEKAIVSFQQDGGKDGPFGTGYALCRLVILLMRCGDNGLTMNILHSPEDDIKLAGWYLQRLEDSDIAIPKILQVHFCLAKTDYQFRRMNTVRAIEHAQTALDLATELNMLEFKEHAHNRLVFLNTKTRLIIEDIDDKDPSDVLFGYSTISSAGTDRDIAVSPDLSTKCKKFNAAYGKQGQSQ